MSSSRTHTELLVSLHSASECLDVSGFLEEYRNEDIIVTHFPTSARIDLCEKARVGNVAAERSPV